MELDNKTISIAAGVYFLWRAISCATTILSLVADGVLFYISPIFLIMTLYGAVVLTAMGIMALRRKQRSKVMNVLGIVYIGYAVINRFGAFQHFFNIKALVSLVLLIAAFVLSQKACGGSIFDTNDTTSEAAKVQIQSEKQTAIYDEQLRDGILTQEEYDQLMKRKY